MAIIFGLSIESFSPELIVKTAVQLFSPSVKTQGHYRILVVSVVTEITPYITNSLVPNERVTVPIIN